MINDQKGTLILGTTLMILLAKTCRMHRGVERVPKALKLILALPLCLS